MKFYIFMYSSVYYFLMNIQILRLLYAWQEVATYRLNLVEIIDLKCHCHDKRALLELSMIHISQFAKYCRGSDKTASKSKNMENLFVR